MEIQTTLNSPKSFVLTLVLCLLFGIIGGHRFYLGKWRTGVLMLITFGGFGIWALVDLIRIVMGRFKDYDGFYISN